MLRYSSEFVKIDKGTAMTLIFQEVGIGYIGRCPHEEVLIATDSQSRILFHKKLGRSKEKRIEFPLVSIFYLFISFSVHYVFVFRKYF